MSEEWSAYTKDARIPCKYGSKCYQQNPNHHSTYKHPPEMKKNTGNRTRKRFSPYSRNVKDVEPDKKTKKEDTEPAPQNTEIKPSEEDLDRTINIELPEDIKYYESSEYTAIKELFLVEMPTDFFKFYEILNADGEIVKTMASVNLELIGPYDLLLGKLPKVDNKELYLVHWRFFYDPPEFQAVLKKKGNSEYHIGYFRDAPNEMPVFLGSNDSAKNCQITILADNIFGAVYQYLQKEKRTSPFTSMACQKLMDRIKKCAGENDFNIDIFNSKKRKAVQATKSLHHAGIVVPYDKKTKLGYRSLVESDESIKKIFADLSAATNQDSKDKILSNLQPVITYASIAVDEFDFGTGLELGIDLFCSGLKELESCALTTLNSAYSLLNRQDFYKIIQTHVKYRRRGPHMSICK